MRKKASIAFAANGTGALVMKLRCCILRSFQIALGSWLLTLSVQNSQNKKNACGTYVNAKHWSNHYQFFIHHIFENRVTPYKILVVLLRKIMTNLPTSAGYQRGGGNSFGSVDKQQHAATVPTAL